ncbi:MAG: hypothetical protein HS128_12095 [Ideonella sp.]|nr:hypothetical protein [Ideonella sp.]MCC7458084.1 hypothetical protein [Nitrospira sp.]
MNKTGFDHEALVEQFAQASARQGDALRQAAQQATLKALQGRELTLKSVRDAIRATTKAASAGAAKSGLPPTDVETLLTRAVEGMDAALVKAVEANRRALEQFVDQGAQLRETKVKKALADIEKMEDALYASVDKAVGDAAKGLQAPWAVVLEGLKAKGSATGSSATAALEQLTARSREAVREGRSQAQSTVDAWMDHYTALARGVLIGLSEGLKASDAVTTTTKKSAGRSRMS